jgi:hypothetical protein
MRTILLFFLLFEKAVKASSFFLAQVSEAGVHAAQDARQKQEDKAAAETIQKVVLHQMKQCHFTEWMDKFSSSFQLECISNLNRWLIRCFFFSLFKKGTHSSKSCSLSAEHERMQREVLGRHLRSWIACAEPWMKQRAVLDKHVRNCSV